MELAADQEGYSSASDSIISNAHFVHALAKRKRTNRQRIQPLSIAVTDSSSASFPEEISGIITEEDDMANCLILLAQGRAAAPEPEHKFNNRRFVDSVFSNTTCVYAYECKTCNKCFPSFQALGGHRTSHKKPKFSAESSLVKALAAKENKSKIFVVEGTDNLLQNNMNSFSAKQKVHECAICGSEFSSGQALGGHMRRHRTLAMVDTANKDYKSFLTLDLNLPAPADVDELQRSSSPSTFALAGNRPLLFSGSASALVVDCHQ